MTYSLVLLTYLLAYLLAYLLTYLLAYLPTCSTSQTLRLSLRPGGAHCDLRTNGMLVASFRHVAPVRAVRHHPTTTAVAAQEQQHNNNNA